MEGPARWNRTVTLAAALLACVTLAALVTMILLWRSGSGDRPGHLVDAVVAASNIAFVIFTWAVFKAGQDQLAQMRDDAHKQSTAWQREHEMARNAYVEAVRARLDQSAPRVSSVVEGCRLTLLGPGRKGIAIDEGDEIQWQDDETEVEFVITWETTNSGEDLVLVRYAVDGGDPADRLLEPGRTARTEHAVRAPVGTWCEERRTTVPCRLEVEVTNLGRDVVDVHTWAEVVPVFTMVSDDLLRATSLRTREVVARRERRYPGIHAGGITPVALEAATAPDPGSSAEARP